MFTIKISTINKIEKATINEYNRSTNIFLWLNNLEPLLVIVVKPLKERIVKAVAAIILARKKRAWEIQARFSLIPAC